MRLNLQTKTEHPYVAINAKICGGSPVVTGTRVRIVDIAIKYEYLNRTPDEIINAHPHLKLEQVHDALSYYYENREATNNKIKEDKQFIRKISAVRNQREKSCANLKSTEMKVSPQGTKHGKAKGLVTSYLK